MRDFGNSLSRASAVNSTATLRNTVGGKDKFDILRFDLGQRSRVSAAVSRLNNNVDLALLDRNGRSIAQSKQSGKQPEQITTTLDPGRYFWQLTGKGKSANYRVRLVAEAIEPAPDNGQAPGNGSAPGNADTAPNSPPVQRKWTVMVYAAADDLEVAAIDDFLEMSSVGSSAEVNVVLQLDRTNLYAGQPVDDRRFGDWTDTRRGLMQKGDQPTASWGTSVGEVDMGNPQTLQAFVNWSMSNYQAEQYALVLWGHGDGLAAAFDEATQDGISAQELRSVLNSSPDRIDLVGTDNCLMSNMEFVHEIRNSTSVFVGSQENELAEGWPYNTVLADLVANPNLTAGQFGEKIVDRYGEYYNTVNSDQTLTLSSYNLDSLRNRTPGSPIDTLDLFAQTVMATATWADLDDIDAYRDRRDIDSDGIYDDYVDILNIMYDIASDPFITIDIVSAAYNVIQSFTTVDGYFYSSRTDSSTGLSSATGLSIYFADRGILPRGNYSSTSFAADTQWDEFLAWWTAI